MPEQLLLAEKTLPFRYDEVVDLSLDTKRLLFAVQKGGPAYSELHMAAGERAVLRLALEIGELRDALILIDELEAGLHPWVQQLLMLQLQQLAVRQDLQFVVTTHSPVVLDSVPPDGRIFLDRDSSGRVTTVAPYHDTVQYALYGRSMDVLQVLCEDRAAEAILEGVFDALSLENLRFPRDAVRIGRDTGADEFPTHAAAFRKFGRLHDFVFVLDGDQRGGEVRDKIHRASAGVLAPVFYLPGEAAPEVWVWEALRRAPEEFAREIGVPAEKCRTTMERRDLRYDGTSGSVSSIAKAKLESFADSVHRGVPELCRLVARVEVARRRNDIRSLAVELEGAVERWRSRREDWL